ncbi:MAG: protein jag [Defluviitaleaceae bacterium]|nr:protein jag [Defluviitaleaceae bacterium]
MNYVEKTGKTVDEAIQDALRELGTSIENVTYEVLEEGAKGFLGIGGRPAKVRVKLNFNPIRMAKDFIKEMTLLMGLAVEIDVKLEDKRMEIDLKGEDLGILIGKRGQTLDALQYLVSLTINKGEDEYINVIIDTGGYRAKRKEALETLAKGVAKKVKMTRRSITLEPMTPYERRVIHSILQEDRSITTYSQGKEPYRSIVVAPKSNKDKLQAL